MIKVENLLRLLEKLKENKRKKKFSWDEKDIVITKKPDKKDKDASD